MSCRLLAVHSETNSCETTFWQEICTYLSKMFWLVYRIKICIRLHRNFDPIVQNATKFWSSFRMALRKVGGTNRNNFESAALVCTTIIFGLPSSVSHDDVSIDMTTAHCQSFIDLYSGFLTWKLLRSALDVLWKYFGTKFLAGHIKGGS